MSDTSSFEEDIDIDDVSPRKISYFPAEIEFFEESPDKKYELTDAKTSENDSSSDKNQNLTSCESFKRDSSAKKTQLSDIDFSTLFEKHNLSETCFTVQKQNVPFIQSSESNCFGLNKEQESSKSVFQKSENGCIFPDKICELADNKPSKSEVGIDLDVQSSENVYSLSHRKRTLSDSSPSERETSTFSHYKSTPETYLPAPNEPSNSSYTHSHETDYYISHLSELLNGGEFSNYNRNARKVVRDLLGDDFSIYSTETITSAESSDVESLPPQSKPGNIESCNVCNQSADDCEKMLRQIIRTAYQFTRHSYRKKLTLKDIEKAFKVHKVDSMLAKNYFPINETDRAAPTNGEELKPFECIGKWLKKSDDS